MPRKARLDAPGALHHIVVRGIERRKIFYDDSDRDDFLERLSAIQSWSRTACYAWALMPNHFHLLLKTGQTPIATLMRRLLTGYAVSFNLRHRRSGHLVQNRYKSILCQEDAYLLELVRYIHLNPLRAKIVADLKAIRRIRLRRTQRADGPVSSRLAGYRLCTEAVRRSYQAGAGSGTGISSRKRLGGAGGPSFPVAGLSGAWEGGRPFRPCAARVIGLWGMSAFWGTGISWKALWRLATKGWNGAVC